MPKNDDVVDKIIEGLSDDDIEALADSIELVKEYDRKRTRYKSVPVESVEYVDGRPQRVVNYKPVSYKDTQNYPDLISNHTKGVSYAEYLESLPYYDEIKDQIFDKRGNRKGLYTPNGVPIKPGVKSNGFYLGLGDASEDDINRHYKVKNSILYEFCNHQLVKAEDFYKDMYSVPDYFNYKDKGSVIYTKKDDDRPCKIFENYNIGVISNDKNLVTYPFDIIIPKSGYINPGEKNIKNIFAIVVDVDSVYAGQLYNFFSHDWGYLTTSSGEVEAYLKPTYIVNSGSGLHLYYVLETPVPYFRGSYHNAEVLNNLIFRIQSKYNTFEYKGKWRLQPEGLSGKPQRKYRITQAFRMAGSATKNNKRVTVYKYSKKYKISELLTWLGLGDEIYKVAMRHSDKDPDLYRSDDENALKEANRIKRLEALKNEISYRSTALMSDLLVYVQNCASAKVNIDKVIEDLKDIVEKYSENHDDPMFLSIDIDDETTLNMIKSTYNSISGHTYINNNMFSFKIKKTSRDKKLKKGYYIGKRNQVINNIVVGHRRDSIFGLGVLAWGCGVPKNEYIKDMEDLYSLIKDRIVLFNQKDLPKSDFQSAIKGYDWAEKNLKYIIPKIIEPRFEYCKDENKKGYEKKKVPDKTYISWLYHRIDNYVLRDIHVKFKNSENIPDNIEVYIPDVDDLIRYIKEKDAEFSDDRFKGLNAEYMRKVNEKVNKTVRYKTDSGDEKEAIVPVSKYLFKKYYSDAIRLFKAIVKKGSGSDNKMMVHTLDDDDNDINVEVTLNYVKTLDNREKVQEAMNKGLSSIQSIMNYTQLSKCSVIKYRKEILGCD